MSTQNPTVSTVNSSSPQQESEFQSETKNEQSLRPYPPATAIYEEVAQSSELFWEKLEAFHNSFGTKFMVPTLGGHALDLHHLFVEVTSRGGIEKVIRDRKWKDVIAALTFPTTITSASFVLRKYYLSLLYHFEQVYHFNKQAPSLSVTDAANGSNVNGSAALEDGVPTNNISVAGSPQLQLGCSVNGTIDGKFDDGYMVSVNFDSGQLKGVLYHIPNAFHDPQNSHASDARPRRRRKRSRLALLDPSLPKSNRSGYNFFFAEHYVHLKPLHHGQEKVISKKIGLMWNNLTEAEKQVYQEKGLKDKERYRTEMLEYKSSYAH